MTKKRMYSLKQYKMLLSLRGILWWTQSISEKAIGHNNRRNVFRGSSCCGLKRHLIPSWIESKEVGCTFGRQGQ